jgi:hypothetical protein
MPQYFSQAPNAELTYEHCQSFGGGMDAYTRSTLLPPDAYILGENIFVQENLEGRTRAGADRVATNLGVKIQGLAYFDIPGVQQLITAANKKLYYTDSALAAWTEMAGYQLSDADVSFSSAHAIDKLLVTDGATYRSWNGVTWDAAYTTNNVDPPTGATVLLWHTDRMWAAGFPGTGGAGKEADAVCVSPFFTFGNGDWNLVDRSFRVGSGDGDPVIGLVSIPASVPEQAILGVLKSNSIHLVRTDPTQDITNFTDTVAPESVANGLGVVGKRAYAVLGNDLFYVAPDRSFRSLQRMQSAAAQYEVSDALSIPLQPYMERINWTKQSTITVSRYRQLALFSVPLDNSQYPNTVFAWSGRLKKWVGIWTGWTPNSWEITRFNRVMRLVHGDNAGNVRLWKDTEDATDDDTYKDDGVEYGTKLHSKAFLFQEPLNDKSPRHAEIRFGQSNAVVNVTLNADNADVKSWQCDVRPTGPSLPIDLDFDLSNPVNTPFRKGLLSVPAFSECYLKLESTGGWFSVKSLSLSAFLNTLSTQ